MLPGTEICTLVDALNAPEASKRLSAQRELMALGSAAADTLMTVLTEGTPIQKIYAAITLGRMGDKRALPTLAKLRTHDNVLIRTDVARSLGAIPESAASNLLLGWFYTETNTVVQIVIAQMLGNSINDRTVDAFLRVLRSTASPSLRHIILKELIGVCEPRVKRSALSFVSDPDHHVHTAALTLLERCWSEENEKP